MRLAAEDDDLYRDFKTSLAIISLFVPVPLMAEEEKRRDDDLQAEKSSPLSLAGEQPPSSEGNPPHDEGPMVTDRPDFTESTVTVPLGRLQLEAGYTFTADDEGGVRTADHTLPEALLRVGLMTDVELRLGWPGFSLTEEVSDQRNDSGRRVHVKTHDDGGTDMSLGFKVHLLDQDELIPDLGLIVETTFPTGAAGKSSGDVDPGLKLLWAYELTDRLGLAGNVNLGWPTSEKGRFFQAAASVSLAYSVTDWLGTYVEYFGFYPNDRNADCAHYINGGFTFPITDDFQIDLRAGVGLNEEADDLFTGVGFAYRF